MTETTRALRRLGRPHARVRGLAVLLAGAGLALGAAAFGIALAPHLAAVLGAWLAIAAVLAAALLSVRLAAASAAALPLARASEGAAGAREGSVATLLVATRTAGASPALFEAADRHAAAIVDRAAPAVTRALARTTTGSVLAGALLAMVGATLFVVAAPGAGRAAGFWRPWRTIALARAPLRLAVDRSRVRRGEAVTATVTVPGSAGGRVTLWTRGPGEPWHPVIVPLDSVGRGVRRLGPL